MPWPRGKYGDSYGGWGNTFEEACANKRRDLGEPRMWQWEPSSAEIREILKGWKQAFPKPRPLKPRADGALTKTEEKRKAIKERRRARLEKPSA